MARVSYTILGAAGFIGGHLRAFLENSGADVYAPWSKDKACLLNDVLNRDLGHVFYCVGLTADFRERPFDTVEAHVCLLQHLLQRGRFESLTYLSSTRVYEGAVSTHELATLSGRPADPGHLYNFSKLMGESLCLNSKRRSKVVRLSNVYGHDPNSRNFLGSVLREAVATANVTFRTAPQSAKDYVSVEDVIRWLPKIAEEGRHSIYNVASGRNITTEQIGVCLNAAGVKVHFIPNAPEWIFPVIDIGRLQQEFGSAQGNLEDDLPELLNRMRCPVTS